MKSPWNEWQTEPDCVAKDDAGYLDNRKRAGNLLQYTHIH